MRISRLPLGSALALPVLALALSASPALASEADAEACVRTTVWDSYREGWAIRTLTSTRLEDGGTKSYLVTLYAGNEYRLHACSDNWITNLDLLVYDLEGNIVARDESEGRQPRVDFRPEATRTYYVVLYAQQVLEADRRGAAALAVTYR